MEMAFGRDTIVALFMVGGWTKEEMGLDIDVSLLDQAFHLWW